MVKDLLTLRDYSEKEILELLGLADKLKKLRKTGGKLPKAYSLENKNLILYFEKPSLRTWVTFQVAMNDLKGCAIYLPPESIQIGKRETVQDIAVNLERWVDGIVARTFSQKLLEELARYARIPVINALSDTYHPCQALAFAQALREHKKKLRGLHVVFVGDGNNVCHSIMVLCSKLGMHFTLAHPAGYGADPEIAEAARKFCSQSKGSISFTNNPHAAVKNADAIYTDTWASMGMESEAEKRRKDFAAFQVNAELVKEAPKGYLVSHCLPAHRGEEITNDVLDNSMAFDEAENRLHVQKAVLLRLMKGRVL